MQNLAEMGEILTDPGHKTYEEEPIEILIFVSSFLRLILTCSKVSGQRCFQIL